MEAINASGFTIPPCPIFTAKVHQQAWYEDIAIPHDWRIEISENGWTIDQITQSCLKITLYK